MISVQLTHKGKRETIICDEKMTVAEVLSAHGVDYKVTPPMLNGSSLDFEEINSTFADLHVGKSCMLTCVVKTSNA